MTAQHTEAKVLEKQAGGDLYSDVMTGCDVCSALRLHHYRADVVDEDGWPLDDMARLQRVKKVCWRLLPPTNLHQVTETSWKSIWREHIKVTSPAHYQQATGML